MLWGAGLKSGATVPVGNASVKLGNTGIFLQQKTQNDTKKFHGNNDVF